MLASTTYPNHRLFLYTCYSFDVVYILVLVTVVLRSCVHASTALRDVVHDVRRTGTDHISEPHLSVDSGHHSTVEQTVDHTNPVVPTLQ